MTSFSPRPLAAVLFDMDGTLLDSERIWSIAIDELAARHGGTVSPDGRAAMVGSPLGRSLEIMEQDLGVRLEHGEAGRFLLDRTNELFGEHLAWKPGARELLTAVHDAGLPTALVTSTQRRLTEVALEWMGRQYFTVSVCGDETARTKPDPEPYLRALELLGVPAAGSVAIEDSPVGTASAHAAGCAVLAVPSEMALPASPAYTLRDTLVGLTVDDLRGLVGAGSQRTVQSGRSTSAGPSDVGSGRR